MCTPTWVTEEFIANALRSYHREQRLNLLQLQTALALPKGENYGGILTRIKVSYQLGNDAQIHEKCLMLKTAYEDDPKVVETMKPYDIFKREMRIYEQVLPRLHELLHDIHDDEPLFPTALYIDYQRQALLFEDLSALGFVMADRLQRLDLEHVLLILKKLAKLHATSAVLNERTNGMLEGYDRGFFNRYTDNYQHYFLGNLVVFAQMLQQQADWQYYGNKLLALAPKYLEYGKRCFEPAARHINVLTHGDVWTNNVMFKYDESTGKPIDVMIIDFQYSFWGAPALDLHHFFNTSIKEPLRLEQQDVLVEYYHGIFVEVLQKLKYQSKPLPSLQTFAKHFEEKRFFSVYAAFVAQPVQLNTESDDADFMAIMGNDERALRFKAQLYQNPLIQNYIYNLLPIFDKRGLFDTNQYD